jgi:hypothetical protein
VFNVGGKCVGQAQIPCELVANNPWQNIGRNPSLQNCTDVNLYKQQQIYLQYKNK